MSPENNHNYDLNSRQVMRAAGALAISVAITAGVKLVNYFQHVRAGQNQNGYHSNGHEQAINPPPAEPLD